MKISRLFILLLAATMIVGGCKKDDKDKREVVEATGWKNPAPESFEYNMTFIGQVEFPNGISNNINTEVAAFVGDECRGMAKLVHEEVLDLYLFHLTIFSNSMSGENIGFRIYDSDNKAIYDSDLVIEFKSNTTFGAIDYILKCEK